MKTTMTRSPFSLIDPFFDEFFESESNSRINQVMRTDIEELKDRYEFLIEMPGVKKEDIKLSLDDGYLTLEASQIEDETVKKNFIRKERFVGSYKRSFYVGEEIKEDDIKAKLEDGILTLTVLKREPEEKKASYISIE